MFDRIKKKISDKFGSKATEAIKTTIKEKVKAGPSDETLELIGMLIGLYTPIVGGYVNLIKETRRCKMSAIPVDTASIAIDINEESLKSIIKCMVEEGLI